MHILNELTYINKSSLALGFFDGIHQGHRVVIKNAVNIAKENNTQSTVIMFKEHPLNFLTNQKIPLILTENERLKMLEELGVDNIVLLDFEKFSNIKAQTYIKDILVKYYSPIAITTGFNHEFGYNKEGNADILRECQTKYGFKYYEIPPYVYDNTVVSCSSIRNSISAGDLQKANKLLGYEFFINSPVIQGEQIARQIGFPSANAVYPEEKIKIPYGVYFVKVVIDNKEYTGVMNYGFSPSRNSILKTEVHIINFDEDIYGKNIKISFIAKIRNQMKFTSTEKLKEQIKRDIAFVEIYKHFVKNSARRF